MKYLVVGGCGFIGSNLVQELLGKGAEVEVADDLSTGTLLNLDITRVRLFHSTKEAVFRSGYDGIFYFAGPSTSNLYQHFPEKSIDKSIGSFMDILDFFPNVPLVYASSSSIYKSGAHLNEYAMNKLHLETLARRYAKRAVGLRMFSVYGPHDEFKAGFANVITQWLMKGKIDVYGNGSQTRDFVYVDDVVNIAIDMMKRLQKGEFIAPGQMDVATGRETSFNELSKIMELPIRCSRKKLPDLYIHHQKAQKSPADWKFIPLEEGIEKMRAYLNWKYGLIPRKVLQKLFSPDSHRSI